MGTARSIRRRWVAIAAMAVAAVMIWIGAARGEARVVEEKAIRICLECIGIG